MDRSRIGCWRTFVEFLLNRENFEIKDQWFMGTWYIFTSYKVAKSWLLKFSQIGPIAKICTKNHKSLVVVFFSSVYLDYKHLGNQKITSDHMWAWLLKWAWHFLYKYIIDFWISAVRQELVSKLSTSFWSSKTSDKMWARVEKRSWRKI